jgi:hypothetical protein
MKLIKFSFIIAIGSITIISCQNSNENKVVSEDTLSLAKPTEEPSGPMKVTSCYLSTFHRDSTFVSLTVEGDTITGAMHWQPYEKDGAIGTLAGKKKATGEFELLYSYMIEVSNQTETKIMKVENNKLLIKKGELLDPNNDGHLIYKDVNAAMYTDTLAKVDCK